MYYEFRDSVWIRGATRRKYKLPEADQKNIWTRSMNTLSNKSNARGGGTESPEAQVYKTREREGYRDWLVKRGGERERDEYNTILRQRSWQREQMYVTEGEQLSLRNEKSAGCSYHVWGKNLYGRTKGITIDGEA